jgi:uncharacterized protein YegP (UPF0339 family)
VTLAAVPDVLTDKPMRRQRPVRIKVYERKGKGRGTFDVRFLAPNGAITMGSQGQGYTSRRDAHRALNAFLKSLGAVPGCYVVEDIP